jgi:hypothetical protein
VVRCWMQLPVMTERIAMSTAAIPAERLLIVVKVCTSSHHLVESRQNASHKD